jgi:hypothetical protein
LPEQNQPGQIVALVAEPRAHAYSAKRRAFCPSWILAGKNEAQEKPILLSKKDLEQPYNKKHRLKNNRQLRRIPIRRHLLKKQLD